MKNFFAFVGAVVILIIVFIAIAWLLQPRLKEWGYVDSTGVPIWWSSLSLSTPQRASILAPDGRRIYCNLGFTPKLQWFPQKADGTRDWRVVC